MFTLVFTFCSLQIKIAKNIEYIYTLFTCQLFNCPSVLSCIFVREIFFRKQVHGDFLVHGFHGMMYADLLQEKNAMFLVYICMVSIELSMLTE